MDMAATETYLADIDFIELVVETVFHEDLGTNIGRLKHKASSIGFLEPDESSRTARRFPHTEIFYHFLAEGLLDKYPSPASQRMLRRANLGADFLIIFLDRFQEIDEDAAIEFANAISREFIQSRGQTDRFETNTIALWLATLSRRLPSREELVLSDHFVPDAALVGRPVRAILSNISVNRMDIRGADLSLIDFRPVYAGTVVVDPDTSFGTSVPTTDHVQLVALDRVEDLRGPDATRWLEQRMPAVEEIAAENEATDLLRRVLFALTKRFAIRDNSEDPAGRLLYSLHWQAVEQILSKYGRIYRTNRRDVSGSNDYFLRVRVPRGLLWESDVEATEIWRRVREVG